MCKKDDKIERLTKCVEKMTLKMLFGHNSLTNMGLKKIFSENSEFLHQELYNEQHFFK